MLFISIYVAQFQNNQETLKVTDQQRIQYLVWQCF